MATTTNSNRPQAVPVTDADIDALDRLLIEMESRVAETEQKGQLLLNGVYVDIVGVVEPIVTKTRARVKREKKAKMRKGHKNLRKTVLAANGTDNNQGDKAESA
jgi:hypothetical protein